MPSNQEIFRGLISLIGKPVEVAVHSTGETFEGRVVNSMFDSFLLETPAGNKVIAFHDLLFLRERGSLK